MKDKFNALKNYIYTNRKMLWYMFCFAFLGLIDQRKQSATGLIQMLFANMTPLVMVALLLPSLELRKFYHKAYVIWTSICIALVVSLYIWGKLHMPYMELRVSGICSILVWSYLFLYIVKEWKCIEGAQRIRQPFFWCIFLLLFLMILSVNQDAVPYWYLMMYGGFYLIGVKKEERCDFFRGLINGVVLWFFVQQIIAFGFRPYDSWRYKGMYAGVTFNGLFYLLVYCATSLKWLLANERKAYCWIRFSWFFLSVGCVSFVLLSGSRAALGGVVSATVLLYGWYDLIKNVSFRQLLLHVTTWLLCLMITYPLVYGCIRYLPTIVHHPIWFEGEYVEGRCVRSFDPWNSDKYTTFEDALDMSVGRLFEFFESSLDEKRIDDFRDFFVLRVYAAEDDMNERNTEEMNSQVELMENMNGINSRRLIYLSCIAQLNWQGHESGEIPTVDGNIYSHAHNMFLDMAYRHGILAGIWYLGIWVYSILQMLRKSKLENIIVAVFMFALLCFGMFEQLTMMGQFGVALIWIFFYFVGENSKTLFYKS